VNSDETKSDDYWMGVRDALRMIDSFVRWSRYNPKKAKNLEDFIADGLIAAAKRCKSCLSKELGIVFKEDIDTPEDSLEVEETSAPTEVPVFFEESSLDSEKPSVSPEVHEASPPAEAASEEEEPDPFYFIDSSPSDTEEKPRDFSSDFELAEPEPLITKPEEMESETSSDFKVTGPPEIDVEEELPSIPYDDIQEEMPSSIEEKEISEDVESTTTIPRFSWDDHDEISAERTSSIESVEEFPTPEEPAQVKVRIWSPYDEPSITEPDSVSEPTETEDAEETESDKSAPTTEEPPSPPPPPETDETEEERKRKARRLFFGT
jgi:hypothetical protein